MRLLGTIVAAALLASPAAYARDQHAIDEDMRLLGTIVARDQHAIDEEIKLCGQQSDFTLNTCMGRATDKNAEAACMNDQRWRWNVCLAIARLEGSR